MQTLLLLQYISLPVDVAEGNICRLLLLLLFQQTGVCVWADKEDNGVGELDTYCTYRQWHNAVLLEQNKDMSHYKILRTSVCSVFSALFAPDTILLCRDIPTNQTLVMQQRHVRSFRHICDLWYLDIKIKNWHDPSPVYHPQPLFSKKYLLCYWQLSQRLSGTEERNSGASLTEFIHLDGIFFFLL